MYFLENDEVKFVILYTLKRFETPITFEDINLILTWENEVLDYFTLAVKFGELLDDEFLAKTFTENREKYTLTSKGAEAVEFFSDRIPSSIKRTIDTAIGNMKFDTLIVPPPTISAEAIPINAAGQYLSRCSIVDDGITMLNMDIFVGDRDVALNISKHFKENASEIYQAILKLCTPKDNADNEVI